MGARFKHNSIRINYGKGMNCYWCDAKLTLVFEKEIENDPYSVRTILECKNCKSQYYILKKQDAFD